MGFCACKRWELLVNLLITTKKLGQLVSEKLALFAMLFLFLLIFQSLGLIGRNVILSAISIAIDAALHLLVLFLLLYPSHQQNKKTLQHMKQFMMQKYLPVFGCYIVFFLVVLLGSFALILPGLLALFFFQYAYLYVAVENDTIYQAFINSAKLVKRIINLSFLIVLVYVIVYFFVMLGSVVLTQGVFAATGTLYLAILKAIVFLDNYKLVKQNTVDSK